MRKTLFFLLFSIFFTALSAQVVDKTPWQHIRTLSKAEKEGFVLSTPNAKVYQFNPRIFARTLQSSSVNARKKHSTIIVFPDARGKLARFKISRSNTMHPALAAKFPEIEAYEGVGLDDPSAHIRFERYHDRLSGMIWSSQHPALVIRALEKDAYYEVFYKKDHARSNQKDWHCHTDELPQRIINQELTANARYSDGQLRIYRLAVTATGEYTQFHGGTQPSALAAIVTTFNRVNGILKRDVGVELQIVPDNDKIIFTNPDTDGLSNTMGSQMLGENQNIIDSQIGNANYDLGHVLSTGGGGVAYLGSVCLENVKAGGVTGAQYPQGDAFDVDFVAHEIGHQLGATHTQNNNCNSYESSSFEPGSGSTIMGYAGICHPNVQNNSDPYFHHHSISQINAVITGRADGCASKTPTNNTPPSVADIPNHTIPHSTPFELEAVASDVDNDPLSYTWEQMDYDFANMPPESGSAAGPLFRSLPPDVSPIRQFPKKNQNNNHTSTSWEVLPSTGRTMDFAVTVRDNAPAGGNTASDDVQLTVAGNAGPFLVTFPNQAESLSAELAQTITWDVANTNQSPVNCTSVDIYLSVDGGETYPIVLASGVPNSGSYDVIFQNNMVTSNARIKIKGTNNVFFDVSDQNFTITEAQSGFYLTLDQNSKSVCQGTSVTFELSAVGINDYNGTVELQVNSDAAINDIIVVENTIVAGERIPLTFQTTNATPTGDYPFTITGSSNGDTFERQGSLTILSPDEPVVQLNEPLNNASEVNQQPVFQWSSSGEGNHYQLQISRFSDFSTLAYESGILTATELTLPLNLEPGSNYFWRVITSNACVTAVISEVYSFTTSNISCQTYQNETAQEIDQSIVSTISSSILVSDAGSLSDITLFFDISHSWVSDLSVSLQSPSGTNIFILNEICGNENSLDLVFGTNGLPHDQLPCNPPISQQVYLPLSSLSVLEGEEINGIWQLFIRDNYELDGGQLNAWGMEICRASPANTTPLQVLVTNTNSPTCSDSADGSILATVTGGTPDYSINWSNGSTLLNPAGLTAGTYEVTVVDSDGNTATAATTLEAPSPIQLLATVEDVTCHDVNNGAINVFATGGTPGYEYAWNNLVQQSSNLNLPAGNYSVTVTDQQNCSFTEGFVINQPVAIEAVITPTAAHDGVGGSIDLSVSGGVAPYEYLWSNGDNTEDLNDLAPGIFTVSITDANGCEETVLTEVDNQLTEQFCYGINIAITLDGYGSENRWELRDGNGEVIKSLGPFNNFEGDKVIETDLCLPPGCYDFTIFDQWGDGMCCAYGQGGYQVTEVSTGKMLINGSSFNKEETKTFCIPSAAGTTHNQNYCSSGGKNTRYEWIESVSIGEQVFQSGENGGYANFTEQPVDVAIGSSLALTLTPGFSFFKYKENWQVYIDFNQDGDFEDEGEQPFIASGNDTVIGRIGIPSSTKPGKTRVRIIMKWGELVDPCATFNWGEVEDFLINFVQSKDFKKEILYLQQPEQSIKKDFSVTSKRPSPIQFQLYPNPARDIINLSWQADEPTPTEVLIYNQRGQLLKTDYINTCKGKNHLSLNVENLPSGLYQIMLKDKNILITTPLVISK